MPIEYNIAEISEDLDDFQMSLKAIDMESVKENTLERIAEKMAEMVRQAVFGSSIRSPADKISPYEGGDGPPMATRDAWIAQKDGNKWTVTPHPQVRQRAVVLNFGYPGTIRPTDSEYMRFTVNGVPTFRKEVPGPEPTGYWQAAFRRMEQSGKLTEIASEELDEEFEEKFR